MLPGRRVDGSESYDVAKALSVLVLLRDRLRVEKERSKGKYAKSTRSLSVYGASVKRLRLPLFQVSAWCVTWTMNLTSVCGGH